MAQALLVVVGEEFADNPPITGTVDDVSAAYARIEARLVSDNPDILEATGLGSPVVQVVTFAEGLPRAYLEWPDIYVADLGDGREKLYMYSPVAYNGEHFVPEGARELEQPEADQVGQFLFAGGWNTPASVFFKARRGTETPGDFDPERHSHREEFSQPGRVHKSFLALGRSLELLDDYRFRKAQWEEACQTLNDEISRIVAVELAEMLVPQLAAGDSYRAQGSWRYGGNLGERTKFLMSARAEGNINFLDAGKSLKIEDNVWFTATPSFGGDYIVEPNTETEEGRELQRLFEAVPPVPSLGDYPELRAAYRLTEGEFDHLTGTSNTVPSLHQIGDRQVLLYEADADDETLFCPPDAELIDTALYIWLVKDGEDRRMGILPPPFPPALKAKTENMRALAEGPSPTAFGV